MKQLTDEYDGVEIGDILSVTRGVIAHGCNSQGVMGGGIAAHIRNVYPRAYQAYLNQHHLRGLQLGEVIIVEVADDLYIANCITQQRYGNDPNTRYVKHSAVKECFYKLAQFCNESKLKLHHPLIGAGLANGDWAVISTIIDDVWEREGTQSKHLWVLD